MQYRKYIFKNLAYSTVFITLCLTSIVWLTQSLRFVDLIINKGLAISTFLYLTLLLLPSLVGLILPIALFCSIIYTYHKLITDSELIVLESTGVSKLGLLKPAMMLGAVVTLVGYLISLYLLPISYKNFKELQYFIRNNYASILIQEGVFSTPISGLTIYVREHGGDGILKGILVHDNRISEKPVTMMAKEGKLVRTEKGPRIILLKGNRQEISKETLSLLDFDSYTLDISMYIDDKSQGIRKKDSEEMFLPELFNPKDDVVYKKRSELFAEGNRRLVWPLYSLALSALGAASLLYGGFSRKEEWHKVVIATVICIVFVATGLGLNFIVGEYRFITPLLYLNVLAILGGSLKALHGE